MWGQSAWVGGQRRRGQVQPRRWTGTLAPGTAVALAQARYGQTGFATLKGGSCGKSYVRVLVKTSALLLRTSIVGQRRVWAGGLLLFSW